MRDLVDALLKRPGVRYLIVGGSIYGLELVIIVLAIHRGASNALAVGLSFWIGVAASFLLQKLFTFGDRRMHHKILLPQIIAVTLLVFFNFGFTLVVTELLQDYVPAVVTRTIALGLTTIWNFYLYKTRIFKSEPVVIG
jgi:putative flippase GtrA